MYNMMFHTNNLLNSITGPNQPQYGENQTPYGQNQEIQADPWYKFWGGRRRSKSRKNRKTCKKRDRK